MEKHKFSLKNRLIIYAGLGSLALSSLACGFFGGGGRVGDTLTIKGTDLFPRDIPVMNDYYPSMWGNFRSGENCRLQPQDVVEVFEVRQFPAYEQTWYGVDDGKGCRGYLPDQATDR